MRRRRRFGRIRRRSVWDVAANFQVDAPGTFDRQGFLFLAPNAAGTRIAVVATLLSSTGIQFTVGGESGKTRRIVGDAGVSSVVDQGNAIGDLFIREALMWAQQDQTLPIGNVLSDRLDLFSNAVQSGEDILAQRCTYQGSTGTDNGIVRPNQFHQWFNEGGYWRWDTKVTRRIQDDTVLLYVVCIKRVPLTAPSVIMGGSLRMLLAK